MAPIITSIFWCSFSVRPNYSAYLILEESFSLCRSQKQSIVKKSADLAIWAVFAPTFTSGFHRLFRHFRLNLQFCAAFRSFGRTLASFRRRGTNNLLLVFMIMMLLHQVPAAIRCASFNLGLGPGFAAVKPESQLEPLARFGTLTDWFNIIYFEKIC